MKALYWRPHKVTRPELFVLMLVAVLGLVAVEVLKIDEEQSDLSLKLDAAERMKAGLSAIKSYREEVGPPINPKLDPNLTGIIGLRVSPVTSNLGSLTSKRATANPNFAALLIKWLREAGVEKGDLVAVGVSGSFPALNLATYCAIEAIGARALVIASATSSQFGANVPDLLWIDIERRLHGDQLIHTRALAASRGGVKDQALDMPKPNREQLDKIIARNGLRELHPKSLTESIDLRMKTYREAAGEQPIVAYVNVGGGTSSVGTSVGKKLFHPGLNRKPPAGLEGIDSVMGRFVRSGVPLVHLVRIKRMARDHGLPTKPKGIPTVGKGPLFVKQIYNRWLAAGVLAGLFLLLFSFIRTPWGVRLLSHLGYGKGRPPPEPMV